MVKLTCVCVHMYLSTVTIVILSCTVVVMLSCTHCYQPCFYGVTVATHDHSLSAQSYSSSLQAMQYNNVPIVTSIEDKLSFGL